MRQLTLGKDILWPPLCACCLKPPAGMLVHKGSRSDNYLVVKTTRMLEIEVPYCGECLSHVSWYEAIPVWVKALLIFLVSGLASLLSMVALSIDEPPPPLAGWLALASPFVLTVVFIGYMGAKRPSPLGEEHAHRGAAIHVGYFDRDQCRLLVLNDGFAEALIALNGGG